MTTPEKTSPSAPLSFWQKLRALRPFEGQSLVWQLIDLQRGVPAQAAAFVGFLLSFHLIFGWSWSMSLAMLISMFLHELGHAAVFALARIRFIILFLFPLGAVAAPINKEEDARSDKLHWNIIGWLLQAGPAVNVGLMVLFLVLRPVLGEMDGDLGQELAAFAGHMVYVNGLLAIMNLIPVWTLDAGQLFKVIYNSLNERDDIRVTAVLLGGALGVLVVMSGLLNFTNWVNVLIRVVERFGWVIFLIVFTFGILNKQGRDNPLHAASSQAMNIPQVIIQLVLYLVLVGLTLAIFAGGLA